MPPGRERADAEGEYVHAGDPAARHNYHPFHATRADLLHRLGRDSAATAAYERAATMAPTFAEQDFLRRGGRASR